MFDQLAQLVVSGIVNGSEYALLGLAFAVIYTVTKRFHYSMSLTFTLSALTVSLLTTSFGAPVWLAVGAALVVAAISGVLIERWIYRPIANSSASSAATLNVFVASLGLAIAGENVIRLLASSQARTIVGIDESPVEFGSVRLTVTELVLVVVAAVIVVATTLLLSRTGFGRMVRATRSNGELAGLLGVRTSSIYLWVFALGSVIVGVAGIFEGARHAVLPDMGVRPVFYAFVVGFLAKPSGPPWRFWVVGLAIGVAESVLALWISTSVTQVIVFGTLFVIVAGRAVTSGTIRIRRPVRARLEGIN